MEQNIEYPTKAQEIVAVLAALGLRYRKWGFKKSVKVAQVEIKQLIKSLKLLITEKERKKHEHRMLLLLQDIETRTNYHVYAHALIEHISFLQDLRKNDGKENRD